MIRLRFLIFAVTALTLCSAVPLEATRGTEVVISAGAVEPEMLRTVLGSTVIFRNRSQRSIEVQFVGYRGWHHVSETREGVVVVFHQTGRHPFVVRFSGSDQAHVHGAVEVDAASSAARATPACGTIRIEDVCLER